MLSCFKLVGTNLNKYDERFLFTQLYSPGFGVSFFFFFFGRDSVRRISSYPEVQALKKSSMVVYFSEVY